MAVDLGDLVESVRGASSPPGDDLYPRSTDDHWIQVLSNAFWEAFLEGWFAGYRLNGNFEIVATTASGDLGRDQQQVIVLFAALSVVRSRLIGLPTRRSYRAGPVQAETDYAASVLVALMKSLEDQLRRVGETAAHQAGAQAVAYFDNVLARNALAVGVAGDYFVR